MPHTVIQHSSDWINAALLGVIQGIAEFIPISSSGHLALMQHYLHFQGPASLYDLMLHLGTIGAIIWWYREEFAHLLSAIPGFVKSPFRTNNQDRVDDHHFLQLIFISTLVTGALGKAFEHFLESLFEKPRLIAACIVFTGVILALAHLKKKGTKEIQGTGIWEAVIIGIAQAVAIAPGISRSGATIATALLLGFAPYYAARYSLIMSVPIILLALTYEILTKPLALAEFGWPLVLGTIIAGIVGVISIKILIAALSKARLIIFSIYCLSLGIIVLLFG